MTQPRAKHTGGAPHDFTSFSAQIPKINLIVCVDIQQKCENEQPLASGDVRRKQNSEQTEGWTRISVSQGRNHSLMSDLSFMSDPHAEGSVILHTFLT